LHSPHANNAAWDLIAEIRPESLIDFDCVLGEVHTVDGVRNSELSILLTSV
jgi:hypothetical protein